MAEVARNASEATAIQEMARRNRQEMYAEMRENLVLFMKTYESLWTPFKRPFDLKVLGKEVCALNVNCSQVASSSLICISHLVAIRACSGEWRSIL